MRARAILGTLATLLALEALAVTLWWRSMQPPGLARISGVVLDPEGQSVHAGIFVLPDKWDEISVLSDDLGRFELVREPGPITLIAGAHGFSESEPLEIELGGGEELADVVLRVRRGGRISGVLQDEAGRPLSGATVACWHGALRASCPGASARTDEQGRFVLEQITPGPVQMLPDAAELVTVQDGGEHELVLTEPRAERAR
jgi:hypothetical protein